MSLPVHIVTICLDAMPFLPMQLASFNRVRVPWTWHVVEGVADNVACTKWCAKLAPRLSLDGTTEFLYSLRRHPRVRLYQRQLWNGKIEMFNTALADIEEPCVLMEMDADELWCPWQVDDVVKLFEATRYDSARFHMRYFVGPNLVTSTDGGYGNHEGEWMRAWRYQPGSRFLTHEPPFLRGCQKNTVPKSKTRSLGLVPDHWAYVFASQVAFKEQYYLYSGAVNHWQRLQRYRGKWPAKLGDFLPWVKDDTDVKPVFDE